MKNQYFGDVSDYRKYGLLRCLIRAGNFRVAIAWMLTDPDSQREGDGKFLAYLNEKPSRKWRRCIECDPDLYTWLKGKVGVENNRNVFVIEESVMLPNAVYFSESVPQRADGRKDWMQKLSHKSEDVDLVFLDPDNGIEVKSTPYGTRKSPKYVYLRELTLLWEKRKSLLLYQHLPHVTPDDCIEGKLDKLRDNLPCFDGSCDVFLTAFPKVLYFLLLHPRHEICRQQLLSDIAARWIGQIDHRISLGRAFRKGKAMGQTIICP